MSGGVRDDEHRSIAAMQEVQRHSAEADRPDAADRGRADDDEVGAMVTRGDEKGVGRILTVADVHRDHVGAEAVGEGRDDRIGHRVGGRISHAEQYGPHRPGWDAVGHDRERPGGVVGQMVGDAAGAHDGGITIGPGADDGDECVVGIGAGEESLRRIALE